jgi:hypothetical protein
MKTESFQGYLTIKFRFDPHQTKVKHINWLFNEIKKYRHEEKNGVILWVELVERQSQRIARVRFHTADAKTADMTKQFAVVQKFKGFLGKLEVKGNPSIKIYEILDGSC